MRQAFKPEFMNRLDDIVVFQSLTEEDLGQIVELYIDRLGRRLGGPPAAARGDAGGAHAGSPSAATTRCTARGRSAA